MTEILHANIFFFIASIATVAFTVLVCIALYQVVRILTSVRALIERIEAGSDMIAEDVAAVRNFVVKGGLISHLLSFFMNNRAKSSRSRSKKPQQTASDLIIDDAE
jgi:hypothetical protein